MVEFQAYWTDSGQKTRGNFWPTAFVKGSQIANLLLRIARFLGA